MDERVIQFRVGVVVVAATSITAILILLFGALPNFERQYTLHVVFPEAPGVAIDTPVRKSGVQIGRVTKVRLLEEGGVVLSMRINRRFPLRRDEFCRISTGSLVTGDAVLEWVATRDPSQSSEPLSDGEFLTNGQLQADPFEVLVNLEGRMTTAFTSIEAAAGSIGEASDEASVLIRSLNTTVENNDDQIARIMQKSETALDGFTRTMDTIDSVVGDPEVKEGLQRSFRELPKMFDETQRTLADAREAIAIFRTVGEKAETNLTNLERFTEPLGDNGERIIASLDDSISSLDAVLEQLLQFTESLNSGEGTIPQLVQNPELYQRLNRAVGNVERVSEQLGPILSDVRIFTDKIARDPSQLGVKGALDRRPTGTGLKFGTGHRR